jgi:hypothetical protein
MYKATGKKINNVVATLIAIDFISCCVLAVDDALFVMDRYMTAGACKRRRIVSDSPAEHSIVKQYPKRE